MKRREKQEEEKALAAMLLSKKQEIDGLLRGVVPIEASTEDETLALKWRSQLPVHVEEII